MVCALAAVEDALRLLQELKCVFTAAWVLEGERLIAVVIRYLIAYYRSMDPNLRRVCYTK
jgi:CBS domain-containing protein